MQHINKLLAFGNQPLAWSKMKWIHLFGEAHNGQNPLTIALVEMTDKEVAKGIYTLHEAYRLAYIKEADKILALFNSKGINQQEFERRSAILNTSTINNTKDYLLFEAHRRANRNSIVIATGIAILSVAIALLSYSQSKRSSEATDRVSSKALQLAEEQHAILIENLKLESEWRTEQVNVLKEMKLSLAPYRAQRSITH